MRGCSELRDQLDRASISIVLNIAEGCGRRSPADKALLRDGSRQRDGVRGHSRFAGVRGAVDERLRQPARSLLVRDVQILTQLIARMAASAVAPRS